MAISKTARLMYLKAILFLGIGVVSVGLILIEYGSIRVALLLGLSIWSFCRLYYFMFMSSRSTWILNIASREYFVCALCACAEGREISAQRSLTRVWQNEGRLMFGFLRL